MLSRADFEKELIPLRAAVELRRKRFLRYYLAGMAVAGCLLVTAVFYPRETLVFLPSLFHMHSAPKRYDPAIYRLFALLCSALLILGPVFSYRGERGFSLERAVFMRLLGVFGPFSLLPAGGITASELHKSGLFDASLRFVPQEGAQGVLSSIRIKLVEAALYQRREKKHRLAFRGMIVLFDRAPSAVPVPASSPKADWLVSDGELQAELAILAAALPAVRKRWDEAMHAVFVSLYPRLEEAIIFRMGKNELPAEKAYRLKNAFRIPLIAPEFDAAEFGAYQWKCASDTCAVAIVAGSGLFSLGSLFAPALGQEQRNYWYEVMRLIYGIVSLLSSQKGEPGATAPPPIAPARDPI